ncbi:MAG: methionyl-tRNA formyltransferase [Bacteroidales bacterium]|jgi:methionyl-tRNA formyltransferase|nr:methionyl-tRNA formyltransferase [Bacteroidales bacterium]
MRIVFMGTPEFAATSLEALLEAGMEVAAVVTAPDKPVGRGLQIRETAVKQCAQKHHLPVLQPEKLKDVLFLEQLQNFHADLFVVVAFRMLPEAVWSMPPLGCINLHASLLPQYRGAAPINWAIMHGETKTGTTVFFIGKEIDTGNILSYREEEILSGDDAGSLHDRLMYSGAKHLTEAVQAIGSGYSQSTPQKMPENGSTLKPAPKIFKETCRINWRLDEVRIHNHVRGLSPYPAAWTILVTPGGDRLMLKIFATETAGSAGHLPPAGTIVSDGRTYLHVAASGGWIAVKNLQLEGKKRMDIGDFLRGIHDDINLFRLQ